MIFGLPSPAAWFVTRAVRRACKTDRPPEPLTLDAARAGMARTDRRLTVRGVRYRPADEVRGEWVEPEHGQVFDDSALLYLHGGGYIGCSPRTHRPLTAALALALRRPVLALDYRLAPEHPFPAALDDAIDGWRALCRRYAPGRLAIAGDSAGGGLALATMLRLRDGGEGLPAAAALFSPWTDLAVTGASIRTNADRCAMFFPDDFALGANAYAGDLPKTHPLISPLYADLAGLPPLLIHVARYEALRDDGLRVAARARDAGVVVEQRAFAHVAHVWQLCAAVMPEARVSIGAAARFIAWYTDA